MCPSLVSEWWDRPRFLADGTGALSYLLAVSQQKLPLHHLLRERLVVESERYSIERARRKERVGSVGKCQESRRGAGCCVGYVWQTALLLLLAQEQRHPCK